MADSVFRGKSLRTARKMTSWLDCLVRGRRRRQQRRAWNAESAAVRVEQLEDRALLTQAPFAPAFDLPASADGARSVVGADIDGDGDTDLVSASQGDDEIVWWENFDGAANTFIPHTVTTLTDGVASVAVADMDGDGDLDIVSASRYDDRIVWFENVNGNGTVFNEVEISTTTNGAISVFVADMDGDGDMDVVSASYDDDEIAWHENTLGDGTTWNETVISTAADEATAVFVADLDGDGDPDIVASSQYDNSIRWFNNTAGDASAFTAATISSTTTGASSVFVADIDGDGDNDIAATAYDDDEVLWFENNGAATPTFAEHVISTTADGVAGVTVGDVDNDGDNDIVAASILDDTVSLFENNGDVFDPLFTSRSLSAINDDDGANSVLVIDIDGDGDNDIVSTAGLDDTVSIHRNETIHKSVAYPVANPIANDADGVYTVALGDLDGDGDTDIVSVSLYDQTLQWFRNDSVDPAEPLFQQIDIMPLFGVRDVEIADVDGNGLMDVIVAEATNNNVLIILDLATNLNNPAVIQATGLIAVRSVYTTDINGDGQLDIVTASSGDDAVRWIDLAAGVINNINIAPADGARDAVAADIDGDGDIDVVVASYYDDRVAWYENTDGDGSSWARRLIDTTANGARTVDVVDIDGDGDIDIVAGSTYDNTVRWYENDGTANPTFTTHILSTVEQGVQDVAVADIDHDGDFDVVTVAQFPNAGATSRIAHFLNDGGVDPIFTRVDIDTTNDRPTSVDIGDVNGDGDLDVVSTSMFDDTILYYENGGGQLGLHTEDVTPQVFVAGEKEAVLKVTAVHNGRAGDSDLEIATFELLLESSAGVPLTQAHANDLIFKIEVWLDDGDGVFDSDDDTMIVEVDPLVIDADGRMTIFFDDGDPNVLIELGTPRDYFIVAETTANAFLLSPKTFIITHDTEASSTGEDAATDFPATIEFVPNVSTPLIDVAQPSVPAPGIPEFKAPNGAIVDTTPTFEWDHSTGGEQYEIMVYDVMSGQLVIHQTGITGESFTPASPLAPGRTYEAFIQAINVAAEPSGFSEPHYFAIDPAIPVPAVPVLTGPAMSIVDTTPAITWTPAANATSYDLLVYNVAKGVEVFDPEGIVGTSYTIVAPLAPDRPYQVFVRSRNAGGVSNWSSPLNFDVKTLGGLQGTPILTGPTSTIPDNTPTVTWTPFAGAIDYHLLIYSISRGQAVVDVQGIGGTEHTTASLAPQDTYQAFVRARTASGPDQFTFYSRPLVFRTTSAAPIPSTPMFLTPARESSDPTPTFIWTEVPDAAAYDILVYDVAAGAQVFIATNQTARHVTPGSMLPAGFYQAHVRAKNAAGETSAWSGPFNFRILASIENDLAPETPGMEPAPLQTLPGDDAVLVSADKAEADVAAIAADHAVEAPTARMVDDTVDDVAVVDLPTPASAVPAEMESIATVMTDWPETDWWNEPERSEPDAAFNPAEAGLAGVALGLALPAAKHYYEKQDASHKAKPRRSNRRKSL